MVGWKYLGWVVGAFHIGVIVLYNALGLRQSMMAITTAGPTTECRLFDRLRDMGRKPPISTYAHLTGIATGYGFYAPHVASPYVIEVVACSEATGKCDTLTRPGWARGAGAVRYRAFTSSLRHLLPKKLRLYETDTLDIRYMRVLARQAAIGIADAHEAHAIRWRTYVVGLPSLYATRSAYATILIDEAIATSIPTGR